MEVGDKMVGAITSRNAAIFIEDCYAAVCEYQRPIVNVVDFVARGRQRGVVRIGARSALTT